MNEKFTKVNEKIIDEIIGELKWLKTKLENEDGDDLYFDFSDVGNQVGLVVGKYDEKDDVEFFKDGFEHGVSVSNGTH